MTTPIGLARFGRYALAVIPSTPAAPAASTSRRVHVMGLLHSERLQFAVPRSPVGPRQHARRLGVADDVLLLRVPAERPPQAQRDVGQVTHRRHAMSTFEIG